MCPPFGFGQLWFRRGLYCCPLRLYHPSCSGTPSCCQTRTCHVESPFLQPALPSVSPLLLRTCCAPHCGTAGPAPVGRVLRSVATWPPARSVPRCGSAGHEAPACLALPVGWGCPATTHRWPSTAAPPAPGVLPLEGVTASPAGVPWMSTVKLCRGFALRCAVPGCSRGPYPPVGDKREVRLPLTSLHRPPLAAEPNPQEQSLSLRLPIPVASDPSLQVAALPQDHAKCTQAVVQVPTEPPQDGEDRETPWDTYEHRHARQIVFLSSTSTYDLLQSLTY